MEKATKFGKTASALTFNVEDAKKQLEEMKSEINPHGVGALIYMFNKRMRHGMQGLHVDLRGLEVVKSNITKGYKVILMPLYKTFMDYFVLSYVNHTKGIPNSFTFGNFEDTPRIMLFDHILKNSGYILSRRKQGQKMQTRYINSSLLGEIVARN